MRTHTIMHLSSEKDNRKITSKKDGAKIASNEVATEDYGAIKQDHSNTSIVCSSKKSAKFFFEDCQRNILQEVTRYTNKNTLTLLQYGNKKTLPTCGHYYCYGFKSLKPPISFIAKISFGVNGKTIKMWCFMNSTVCLKKV